MGETGIGKTALIDLLTVILETNLSKFNVHAGVTEDEVSKFVQKRN